MPGRFRIESGFALVAALLLSFLFVSNALAGGWAVISLDELPLDVVAGAPLTVGFTVLQHGRTPMTDLHPTITANLYKDAEFVVDAEAQGKPGHYVATLTFPREGDWQWSIQAFTMDQPMPMLSVSASGPASASIAEIEPALSFTSPTSIFSMLAIAGGLAGSVIAFRRRNRQVMVLTVLSLLVGITLFIVGAGSTSRVEAQTAASSRNGAVSSPSQVEFGKQLFIAKGCITCHQNSKMGSSSDYWTIDMGAPNLSKFSAVPEVISMRLKDPASVKSDTKMPNLDLTDVEIEALLAFINSK